MTCLQWLRHKQRLLGSVHAVRQCVSDTYRVVLIYRLLMMSVNATTARVVAFHCRLNDIDATLLQACKPVHSDVTR